MRSKGNNYRVGGPYSRVPGFPLRPGPWGGLLSVLLWSSILVAPAVAQNLRFSNRREVAIPKNAVLRIGPFYSTARFTQRAGYRYTRSTGAGTDFLIHTLRPERVRHLRIRDGKRGIADQCGLSGQPRDTFYPEPEIVPVTVELQKQQVKVPGIRLDNLIGLFNIAVQFITVNEMVGIVLLYG